MGLRILGLDPGLADTGWGVVEQVGSRVAWVAHGHVQTPAGLPLEQRLLMIHQAITEVIESHGPRAAAVESLFFAKNASSALPVAHARGVLYLLLAQKGLAVREFTPMVIKQAVLGSGSADKKQVQAMVRILLGLARVPEPNHAADALAAAICMAHGGYASV